MKKIVIFTQNLDIGGVQKSVKTLSNYLASYCDIKIVLAEDNKNIAYDFNNITILKIKTLDIDISQRDIGQMLFDYRIQEFDKILEQVQPDIVISYEDYNNLISLNTQYKCKKIISCRVSISDSFKNKKIHLLSEEFYHENIQKYYPFADKIICVGKHIEKELINDFSLSNSMTIYNGIKTHQEKVEDIKYDNFIVTIGRLHPQKGQKDLIVAFDMIKDKISQKLLIVGDGIEKDNLQSLIDKLNLNDRVFLMGFDTPYKYIKKCDLFIFPSYYEGFSNTILEVMSMKKNIVSYNYKGSEEILFPENIVESANIESLANRILFYIENKNSNDILENKLYQRSQEFSLDQTLLNYKMEILSI